VVERIDRRLSLDTIVVLATVRELATKQKCCQLCNSFFVTVSYHWLAILNMVGTKLLPFYAFSMARVYHLGLAEWVLASRSRP